MYVPGDVTVICNETGGVLNLGIIDLNGQRITMSKKLGNYLDVEDRMGRDQIRAYSQRLEMWTQEGLISWHRKGSKPTPLEKTRMRLPREGESVTAPPNQYDDALNELLEKEKQEDERTKVSARQRLERKGTGEAAVDAAEHVQAEMPKRETVAADDFFSQWDVDKFVEYAVRCDVIQKKGNWFRFDDENIANGFGKTCSRIQQDVELRDRIAIRLPVPE